MPTHRVRVIPLGGVGEVGKNSYVMESGPDMVVVDAGVKFPEEEMHGIDLVIPDFSYVVSKATHLKGIVLTHGHEDHIGAVPYLLPQLNRRIPIYGSDLTLGLLNAKLEESGIQDLADLHIVRTGDRVRVGPFLVEFFEVDHSVPGSFGVALHSPAGTVIYTGDFKFGEPGLNGWAGLVETLADLGKRGVLALLSDCVRVEQPGRTPPESIVTDALEKIFASAPGRIILTTFASNVARWRETIQVAARHNRKVAIAGRSLGDSIGVASDLGYLDVPPGVLISLDEAKTMASERVVLLVTGSQGEPTSVLSRMAMDDYRMVSIQENDTVVMAASPVPGNEDTVAKTIDNLFRRGARVIYSAIAENVHVSGHASRDELREMLVLTRPEFAVPVHGEYRHMVLYQDLAEEVGIDRSRVILAEQGEVMEFGHGFGEIVDQVPFGSVLVDGITVGEVTQVVLRDRRRLAEDGVLIASIAIDRETGELIGGPDLISRGFVRPEDRELLDRARSTLRRALRKKSCGQVQYGYMVDKISDVLGSYVYQTTRRRPLILPVVTEV